MTISRKEGPFVAELTGRLLIVQRRQTDETWGALTGSGISTLFLCPLRTMPGFVMHSDGLYAQNAHDALTPLYRGDDATQLFGCITRLLTTVESKRLRNWRLRKYGCVAAALILAVFLLRSPGILLDLRAPSGSDVLTSMDAQRAALTGRGHAPAVASATADVPDTIPTYKHGWRTDNPVLTLQPQQVDDTAAPDRWSLPLSVRAELPGKLRNAASRGLFTVPLSSGHARTIYVFADPECANCQRMERHFETAAGTVNVVIFPVTIEGGKSSLDALTPVMAMPENGRATAWKNLFAVDAGIGVPGGEHALPAVTDETQAETARGAIGVNEVAFRAYRLPGTPWTISDDGRYVPQSVLSSPAALESFLNGGGHGGQ